MNTYASLIAFNNIRLKHGATWNNVPDAWSMVLQRTRYQMPEARCYREQGTRYLKHGVTGNKVPDAWSTVLQGGRYNMMPEDYKRRHIVVDMAIIWLFHCDENENKWLPVLMVRLMQSHIKHGQTLTCEPQLRNICDICTHFQFIEIKFYSFDDIYLVCLINKLEWNRPWQTNLCWQINLSYSPTYLWDYFNQERSPVYI